MAMCHLLSSRVFLFVIALISGISPVTGENFSIIWIIPESQNDNYKQKTAVIGDEVTFNFVSGHNVYIHPSGTCDETDRRLVGETSGAKHTFLEADEGTVVFACDAGDHCEDGQIISFSVTSTTTPVADTTPPTAAPTPPVTPTTSSVGMNVSVNNSIIMLSMLMKLFQFF
mmetsp:Transcript_29788/g.28655  ORF Transcript_29788/g.28655 Transcript_29788/m.28655 type:complete len:171 (-) Transcript_29788:247-759(-)